MKNIFTWEVKKLGKEQMQVLDPLMCGTNERKQ
jgi:hypothetical protein